jgi:hypothetical protein
VDKGCGQQTLRRSGCVLIGCLPQLLSASVSEHYGPITRLSGTLLDDDQQRFARDLAAIASR